jgi:ketosteroid isomerase-like protein
VSRQDVHERNIELTRRSVDAWNRQDIGALTELTDPACTWEPALEAATDRRRYEGHAGWREYFQDLAEIAETARVDFHEYRAVGDRVVGLGRVRILWKSGLELEQDAAGVWTWRDGKATSIKAFLDQAEALAAAGLSS